MSALIIQAILTVIQTFLETLFSGWFDTALGASGAV